MALKKQEKEKIIKELACHEKDTGSAEVQIGLLSKQINKLVAHLKKNPKDIHSRRGLIKMVVTRRKLLDYLKKSSQEKYQKIIQKIGLKK